MKGIAKAILIWILTTEAKYILRRYQPKIIAVSGSVGKTSTKDAIYTALSKKHFVRKSEKSMNSEFGVPLTIIGRPNAWSNPLLWIKNIVGGLLLFILPEKYPEWLVLEVGSDHPGDIKWFSKWLSLSGVVLTRFPELPVHVEFFGSPEEVNDEDYAIVEALRMDGTLFVNADDEEITKRAESWHGAKVRYGFAEGADVQGSDFENNLTDDPETSGISFTISSEGESEKFLLPGVIGLQHAYPLIAAIGVAQKQGVSLHDSKQAFLSHVPPRGRMRLIKGEKGTIIIDDTYNSSPVAVTEAIAALKSLPTHRRTIVAFGDMLELGNYSIEAHKEAGKELASVADILITVGVRAHFTALGAVAAKMKKKSVHECRTAEEAGVLIEQLIEEGDVILIKGSQSIRMERCVEQIMAEPERKEELLVRQEAEWIAKS